MTTGRRKGQSDFSMKRYKITVLPGDGIGPRITAQAVRVIDVCAEKFGFETEYDYRLIGGAAIDETGEPLPGDTVAACKGSDAVLLAAVGGAKWDSLPGDKRPEAGLLGIRGALGLFANLRPARVFAPLAGASPLKPEIIGEKLDIMIVRELTGGIYFGERGRTVKNGENAAFDTEIYTVAEIERIARVGFEQAKQRGGRLCSVDKANVLESSRLWRETVNKISEEYPDIELTHLYVDNCAMQLVRDPSQFDVIVTSNMFGDILSDEASMLSGSIGMLASASLNETGFGLYEPVHGSAPDIAGKNTANPLAMILSAAMMLKVSLGQAEAAQAVEDAVSAVLETKRTADIYEDGKEKLSTSQMGDAVIREITGSKV